MNYNELAKKGRGGDTELRHVAGKLSHVNSSEAALIDEFGSEGEKIVQALGSGTINPETGLPEYKSKFARWLNKQKRKADEWWTRNITDTTRDIWKDVFPDEPEVDPEVVEQAGDIVGTGLGGLQQQYATMLGTGDQPGIIDKQLGISLDRIDLKGENLRLNRDRQISSMNLQYDKTMDAINQASRSGLVSGTTQRRIDKQQDLILQQSTFANQDFAQNMQNLNFERQEKEMGAEKERVDLVKSITDSYNRLLTDYQIATGEAYGGGEELDALEELLNPSGNT